MPILAAPDATTSTTTAPASTEGTAAETVPVDAAAPADSAPVATDTVAATAGSARNTPPGMTHRLPTKTSAATAADPALVQEVDPNYDGIACEEMMV